MLLSPLSSFSSSGSTLFIRFFPALLLSHALFLLPLSSSLFHRQLSLSLRLRRCLSASLCWWQCDSCMPATYYTAIHSPSSPFRLMMGGVEEHWDSLSAASTPPSSPPQLLHHPFSPSLSPSPLHCSVRPALDMWTEQSESHFETDWSNSSSSNWKEKAYSDPQQLHRAAVVLRWTPAVQSGVIPVVNMWTSCPALHVWLHADCLFALKQHQSVHSVTSICFCILKRCACRETKEKAGPLMLIDSYLGFCLTSPIFFHFSIPVFFASHLCSLHFLSSPYRRVPSLCFVIPIKLLSSFLVAASLGWRKEFPSLVQMQVWKNIREEQRGRARWS